LLNFFPLLLFVWLSVFVQYQGGEVTLQFYTTSPTAFRVFINAFEHTYTTIQDNCRGDYTWRIKTIVYTIIILSVHFYHKVHKRLPIHIYLTRIILVCYNGKRE